MILELTEHEALTLAAITGRISGDPKKSPRGYVSRIGSALAGAGFDYDDGQAFTCIDIGMHMSDYPSDTNYPENNR